MQMKCFPLSVLLSKFADVSFFLFVVITSGEEFFEAKFMTLNISMSNQFLK